MALGGTEVGDAYISIHAEGRRLREEIKRQAEQAGREGGESGSKEFSKTWSAGLSTIGQRTQRRMLRDGTLSGGKFADAFGEEAERHFKKVEQRLASALFTGDFRDFEKQFGGIANSVGEVSDALGRLRASGQLTKKDFDAAQESLAKWADARSAEEAEREWERLGRQMSEALRLNQRYDIERERALRNEINMQRTARLEMERDFANREASQRRQIGLIEQARKLMEADFEARARGYDRARQQVAGWERMLRDAYKANEEFDKRSRETWDNQGRMVERAQKEMARHFQQMERDAKRAAREMENSMSGLFLGRLRGSRNDFLNIVGRMFVPLERTIGRLIPRVPILGSAFERMGEAISNIGREGSRFNGIMQSIGGSLPQIATGLVTVAISAGILVTALGILVSLGSSLLGILTALAGSVAFALAGVLLTLGPAALAAAAGIGTLITAFTGLEGSLDDTVQPIKDWFGTVRSAVQANMFGELEAQIGGLIPTLERFVGPLLTDTAAALSTAASGFVAALNSPGVQDTLTTLGETLPVIMGNFASALGGLLLGILGFFAPISEAMVPISDRLSDIMGKFAEWANSAEGQNTIRDFFDRAWESAEVLWGLIGSVSDALGALFSQGKEDGDGMLTTLTNIIDEFARWANTKEGREAIKAWFDRARETAGTLADAIGRISEAIIALDTPENHRALQAIITAFGYVGTAIEIVNGLLSGTLLSLLIRIAGNFDKVVDAIDRFMGALNSIRVPGPLGAIIGVLSSVIGRADEASAAVRRLSSQTAGISASGGSGRMQMMAAGGVLNGPRVVLAGEAGREAIVPLDRPLHMVDKSVRQMAALIRGQQGPAMASGGIVGGGRVTNVYPGAVVIHTQASDPRLVSSMTLDALADLAK